MAKKPRTPPPPRRVQAPKRRAEPSGPRRGGRGLIAVVAAVVVLAAAAAAAAYVVFRSQSASAVLADAGCTVQTYPAQGRQHVTALRRGFEYNSDPPTSGPHHPVPAPFDVYEQPVEQLRLVHNLEHGGVVIQYGRDVPRADVDALVQWYRDDPNGIVIAPLPRLGSTIALAAWTAEQPAPGQRAEPGEGVLAKCRRFDEGAFNAFVDEYGFRGPEPFRREDLPPGA